MNNTATMIPNAIERNVGEGTSITADSEISTVIPLNRTADWAGQGALTVGMFCLLFGIVDGAGRSWSSPLVIGTRVVGALGMAAFVLVERRVAAPIPQLDVFKIPAFSAAAVAAVIGRFSFLGGVYALSSDRGASSRRPASTPQCSSSCCKACRAYSGLCCRG